MKRLSNFIFIYINSKLMKYKFINLNLIKYIFNITIQFIKVFIIIKNRDKILYNFSKIIYILLNLIISFYSRNLTISRTNKI